MEEEEIFSPSLLLPSSLAAATVDSSGGPTLPSNSPAMSGQPDGFARALECLQRVPAELQALQTELQQHCFPTRTGPSALELRSKLQESVHLCDAGRLVVLQVEASALPALRFTAASIICTSVRSSRLDNLAGLLQSRPIICCHRGGGDKRAPEQAPTPEQAPPRGN